MRRAVIIGNVGGGKSTLAVELGRAYGLPVHHLDRLRWQPGWVPVPADEFETEHRRLLAGERWVLEGWGVLETLPERLAAADTVVHIDHPLPVHLWWAARRLGSSLFRPRPELGAGYSNLRAALSTPRTAWHFHRVERSRVRELIARLDAGQTVHVLRSPGELEGFRRGLARSRPEP